MAKRLISVLVCIIKIFLMIWKCGRKTMKAKINGMVLYAATNTVTIGFHLSLKRYLLSVVVIMAEMGIQKTVHRELNMIILRGQKLSLQERRSDEEHHRSYKGIDYTISSIRTCAILFHIQCSFY
ncbi:MAG: hypothetical protein CMF72_26040 [Mameliella sp.]|nr:hypothetical protein [Mameliella sp.]